MSLLSWFNNPAFNAGVRARLDEERRNTPAQALSDRTAANNSVDGTDIVFMGVGTGALLFNFSDLSLAQALGVGVLGAYALAQVRPGTVRSWGPTAAGAGIGAFAAHNLRVSPAVQLCSAGAGAFILPRYLNKMASQLS